MRDPTGRPGSSKDLEGQGDFWGPRGALEGDCWGPGAPQRAPEAAQEPHQEAPETFRDAQRRPRDASKTFPGTSRTRFWCVLGAYMATTCLQNRTPKQFSVESA